MSRTSPYRTRIPGSMPARQRGVVLFIALIVLVAMTMAGIAMVRSVDTANVVAGNLGFKQASINAGDQGAQEAFKWLVNNAGTTVLINDNPSAGYFSSRPAQDPDWNDPATWTNAKTVTGSGSNDGNVVSYIIHRMCVYPNTAYNGTSGSQPQQCALQLQSGGANTGSSMAVGAFQFTGIPNLYYRITSRIQGPRNTVSYIQVMAMITN